MISVKGGTQTWSQAQQESSLKADKVRNLSVTDEQKALGDKDLGEVLNKIADPNWVDPVKARKVGNNELGKDAFLKLLLAQLKNQDPTSPMESHEMAAQLAQFTSLEKLTDINTGIDSLSKAQDPNSNFETLNMLGKQVSGDSSKIIRSSAKDQHGVRFELAADAPTGDIRIRNANGEVIREQNLAGMKKGSNTFDWNGLDDRGQSVPPGEYQVVIEAKDMSGRKISVDTKFEGLVSGVNFTADGPVLKVGNKTIKMSEVKSFVDPQINQNAKAQEMGVGQLVNPVTAKDKEGKVGAAPAPASNSNIQSNLAMSRGMMDRLAKETGQ